MTTLCLLDLTDHNTILSTSSFEASTEVVKNGPPPPQRTHVVQKESSEHSNETSTIKADNSPPMHPLPADKPHWARNPTASANDVTSKCKGSVQKGEASGLTTHTQSSPSHRRNFSRKMEREDRSGNREVRKEEILEEEVVTSFEESVMVRMNGGGGQNSGGHHLSATSRQDWIGKSPFQNKTGTEDRSRQITSNSEMSNNLNAVRNDTSEKNHWGSER